MVIAIIAILASLLLASLAGAKSRADSVVCKSNLHQITLGFRMYVDDDHIYPAQAGGASWMQAMVPYVGAPVPLSYRMSFTNVQWISRQGVWVCPGYDRQKGITDYSSMGYGYNSFGVCYYGVGLDFLRFQLGIGYNHPLRDGDPIIPVAESAVVMPSDMIAFGDTVLYERHVPKSPLFLWGMSELDAVFDPGTNAKLIHGWVDPQVQLGSSVALQAITRRHGGRWNIAFCDGHLENLRAQDFCDASNPWQRCRWNRDHLPHIPP